MSSTVINSAGDCNTAGFDLIQNRIESLSSKMDKLINIQVRVLSRLDGMSEEIDVIEKDVENLMVEKEEIHLPLRVANQTQEPGQDVREICQEMSTIMSVVNQRSEQQAQKLEVMEKLVLGMQQVIGFIGETVKRSKIMELIFKGPEAQKGTKNKDGKGKQTIKRKSSTDTVNKKPSKVKDQKGKDGTNNPCLSPKVLKAQKKMKPLDAAEHISVKKQALLLHEVQKLNRENSEKSAFQLIDSHLDLEAGVSLKEQQSSPPACSLVDYLLEDSQVNVAEKCEVVKDVGEKAEGGVAAIAAVELKPVVEDVEKQQEGKKPHIQEDQVAAVEVPELPASPHNEEKATDARDDHKSAPQSSEATEDQIPEVSSTTTESFVTQEHFVVQEYIKTLVLEDKDTQEQEREEDKSESEGWAVFAADGVEFQFNLKQKLEKENKESTAEKDADDENPEQYFIDATPPPAAPFNHRIVSAKPIQIRNFYTINWQEVLGGGRFGQVHKCVENSSGLTLAAKVIKARSQKEKDVVKNEIQVMNNLDHANLIKLYAAYESRNDIILVLEYVGGGELFDRIIDENYTLMELDAVMFIRQICEGVQHMHKMSVLHLDLKPENILCVNRVTNKVKIIDFGLARKYKPREKLKVNFGTPEFLAPEVVNYDFVSFNTDMWSLGVITYMLLSGLSPFLGDDDTQTLNNILACQWNFEEQEFVDTSEEAKDFITRLLIANKCWRMGACEALRHPWLSDPILHHRLFTKKSMCRSRRSSFVPINES
ncbi:uncharacterized protein mylk4a [Pholidichthys leucotaenia]